MRKLLILLTLSLQVIYSTNINAKVIHSERSLYRNILVQETGDLRCLKFNVKENRTSQSCFLKSNPDKLVFNYTKLMLASLLIQDPPKRILIIGLGGGTMSNTLHSLFSDAEIDNVEIDPSVLKVARNYFSFFENDRVKSYVQDGRIFVKRALLKNQQYDWIILDAFNGDYIPEHLLTKEFLEESKQLLSENGVLSANTFSSSKLYAHESATYKAVFGHFYNVRNRKNDNRIILAARNGIPDSVSSNIFEKRPELIEKLMSYNVDMKQISTYMESTKYQQDWSDDTRVLTDQFSPANLLNIEE